ncbi:MAG: hypothetical protein ACR2LE_09920 [Nocardioidaceae bacterium]
MTTQPTDHGDHGDHEAGSGTPGYIADEQLPEDLRPEATDLLGGQTGSQDPSATQRPNDDGLADSGREHAGQITESTTEVAPGDDPEVNAPPA